MKQGLNPSLDEIAEEALVSRATAYRYFPGVEALLIEAALHLAMPEPEQLFADGPADPVARVERLDSAVNEMMLANEASLRMMLINSLELSLKGGAQAAPRQNRRMPLIEAALEPARKDFAPAKLDKLKKSLALIIGTEAMVVFKDVLQVGDEEARAVKRWAIRALVDAARK
jgi:AcrR family transcriptional regulator